MMSQVAIYGALAVLAVAATWPHPGARQVGLALFASWIVSLLTFLILSYEYRPVIFPIIDTLFALVCAKAGKETGSRAPLFLIGLSILAICANAAFSFSGGKEFEQLYRYTVIINIVFILQCLITVIWGLGGWSGALCRVACIGNRARRLRGHPQSVHFLAPDSRE